MLDLAREWFAFLSRRIGALAASLLIVSVATFAVLHFVGNPVYLLLGPRYTQEMLDALTQSLGLDKPVWQQYAIYIGNILRGDFGVSHYTGQRVADDIAARFPATLELSTYALLIGTLWAVPAGLRAGMHPRGLFARFADIVARAGVSMPSFWLGLLLIYVFFAEFSILPAPLGRIDSGFSVPVVTGFLTVDAILAGNLPALRSALAHLAMPALALAVTTSPSTLQIVRAQTETIMQSDYIRSANAFGLPRATIVRYAFRNMLGPLLTIVAMTYGYLLSGAVLVEVVFSWPGLGLYAVKAMNSSDYEPVMAVVLVSTAFYLLVYMIADILAAIIDPRARTPS